MNILKELGFLVRLSHARHIARRYFVVNGFDGALAMLGLNMGFYVSGGVAMSTAVGFVSQCAPAASLNTRAV